MDTLVNIHQAGYRLTAQRRQVLEALTGHPQSAIDIFHRAKRRNFKLDQATVYRNLDLFVRLGLVKKVMFNEKITLYELTNSAHHHHLVCQKCHSVSDVFLDEKKILNLVSHQSNFQIESHNLEFFGFCSSCR
jgi:Fur family transcriptional regulator, ferric uptake regulator